MDDEELKERLKGLQGWEVYYGRRYTQTVKKHYAIKHAKTVVLIKHLKKKLGLPIMTDEFDLLTEKMLIEDASSRLKKTISHTTIVMDDLKGKIDIAKLEAGEFSEKLLEKVREIQAKQKLTKKDYQDAREVLKNKSFRENLMRIGKMTEEEVLQDAKDFFGEK